MELLRTIYERIKADGLLPQGCRAGVGFSGGIDSSVLLHLLARINREESLGWHITALHFDHQLREASSEERRFCEEQAAALDIPIICGTQNVQTYCTKQGVGIEEGARLCRYAFYKQHTECVVLGHHQDDQVETILHNIVRGTGLAGLSGMAEKAEVLGVTVVRPMLAVPKSRLQAYAAEQQIDFQEDPSNAETVFTRSRIRHELIPVMEALNLQAVEHITGLGIIAADAQELVQRQLHVIYRHLSVQQGKLGVVLDCRPAPELSGAELRLAAHALLEQAGCVQSRRGVEQVCRMILQPVQGSVTKDLAGGGLLRREYDRLELLPAANKAGTGSLGETILPCPGTAVVDGRRITCEPVPVPDTVPGADCGPDTEYIDADTLAGTTLLVRGRRLGDRFYPLGAPGERKLKDFLIDCKVPAAGRDKLLLVQDGEGIIWVAGCRISERVKITAATRSLLKLTVGPV